MKITRAAYDYFVDQPDFIVPYQPESNILCFVHQPPGLSGYRLSSLQLELRNRVRAGGRYLLSKVDLNGQTMLRIVLMNHRIGLSDIAGMGAEIRRHARDILENDSTKGGQDLPLGSSLRNDYGPLRLPARQLRLQGAARHGVKSVHCGSRASTRNHS